MCLDSSTFSPTDVRSLQDIIKKLDEEVEDKTNQIYELQKQKYLQDNSLKASEAEIERAMRLKAQAEERAGQLQK